MRYFDGLNASQIATELGLAPGTVRRYIADGVTTLSRTHGDFGLQRDDMTADDADVTFVVHSREAGR